ncbi:MAG: hypothetical protein K5897_02845 [Eubacterium sp.]|nr:hypothetical protein [Eubacterium sp.]
MKYRKKMIREPLSFWLQFLAFIIAVFSLLLLNYIDVAETYFERVNDKCLDEMAIDVWMSESDVSVSEDTSDRLFFLMDKQSIKKRQICFCITNKRIDGVEEQINGVIDFSENFAPFLDEIYEMGDKANGVYVDSSIKYLMEKKGELFYVFLAEVPVPIKGVYVDRGKKIPEIVFPYHSQNMDVLNLLKKIIKEELNGARIRVVLGDDYIESIDLNELYEFLQIEKLAYKKSEEQSYGIQGFYSPIQKTISCLLFCFAIALIVFSSALMVRRRKQEIFVRIIFGMSFFGLCRVLIVENIKSIIIAIPVGVLTYWLYIKLYLTQSVVWNIQISSILLTLIVVFLNILSIVVVCFRILSNKRINI